MKILVTGVNGQLGHDVMNELALRGIDGIGSDITGAYAGMADGTPVTGMMYVPLDITDRESVECVIRETGPDAVIHCAAWTAVDAAEETENRDKVYAVNALGPKYLAGACAENGVKMMLISTDYVFDGQGTEPREPDDEAYCPLNVYGQTKLAGEKAVRECLREFFIVRIAWVFGQNGNNFVKTMLKAGKTHHVLRVVDDQIGTPTYTADLARLLVDMILTDRYGIYHATNEGGFISWYDFAREIFRIAGTDNEIIPVTTAEYGAAKAKRPFNSRLSKRKLAENGFKPLPDWRDALKRYIASLEQSDIS